MEVVAVVITSFVAGGLAVAAVAEFDEGSVLKSNSLQDYKDFSHIRSAAVARAATQWPCSAEVKRMIGLAVALMALLAVLEGGLILHVALQAMGELSVLPFPLSSQVGAALMIGSGIAFGCSRTRFLTILRDKLV